MKLKLGLPASPTENSLEGRAFVFSAFAVSVLSIVIYGQEYGVQILNGSGVVTNAGTIDGVSSVGVALGGRLE